MEQSKVLEKAMEALEKKYGEGAIMRLGDRPVSNIAAISTSSLSLDIAIGIGGVPRGRIVEIYGPESSGKTTLALHIIAEAQKAGEAAFIDAEHSFDADYAKALGVDIQRLLISQPDNGEQALEIVEALVRTAQCQVIVVDSVAALVPVAEINGDMGSSMMGLQARLMSQAMRKLTAVVAQSNTCLIFINQLRDKLGVVFGSPETTTGGKALKFYTSVRLDIRRIGALKDGDELKGNRTRVKVVKNKVAPPFKEAEFDILWGKGIYREGDILDLAVEHKIVEKGGAWYSYKGQKWQGRDKAAAYLKESPELLSELEKLIKELSVQPK